jgi:DNA-binding NtrC family response regulator
MSDLHSVTIVHKDPAIRARLASILEQAGLEVTAIEKPPAMSPINGGGEAAAVVGENGHANGNGHAAAAGKDLLDSAVRDEMTLRELSDLYTARVLVRVNGNKVRAARILGINRRTLYRRGEARRRDAALRAAGDNRERDH